MKINSNNDGAYKPNFKARVSADLTAEFIKYCGKNAKKGMKLSQKIQDVEKWAFPETELGFRHQIFHYKKLLTRRVGTIDSFEMTISNPEVREFGKIKKRHLPIKEKSSMRKLFNAFMKLDEASIIEQEKNLFNSYRF